MAGDPFATVEDLVMLWQPLAPEQEVAAQRKLEIASELIRHRVPSIDQKVAAGKVSSEIVMNVAVEMVKRSMQEPVDGATQQSESAGPFTVTRSFDSRSQVSRGLYMLDNEVRLLTGTRTSPVRSIRVRL